MESVSYGNVVLLFSTFMGPCSWVRGSEMGAACTHTCLEDLCDLFSAAITLGNFEVFSCDTRTFKSHPDFNEFTAEENCLTDQYAAVFCVGTFSQCRFS